LQCLGAPVESVASVARVAVNLRGVPRQAVRRGAALLTPGAWRATTIIDVRLSTGPAAQLPRQVVLHTGTAAVVTRVRPLGVDTARLCLAHPLPLRIGDRALLRDPGCPPGRCSVPAGVTVLDVAPPLLRRRGAAAARATELSTMDGTPDGAAELHRRGLVRRDELIAMGAPAPAGAPQAGGWLVDPTVLARCAAQLTDAVAEHTAANPLQPGLPLESARHLTGLPDARLVDLLLGSQLVLTDGRVHLAGPASGLPDAVRNAIATLRAELAARPFAAPEAHQLAELGLGTKELAAAVRAGELLKIAEGIYLTPGADNAAIERLRDLPSPFTLSQARQTLDTTRRVTIPIMKLLAHRGLTRQLPDGTHELRS
ncbi:MAG: SelB C-terminal domain-containing protein, partial [Pseudonocardiaceae bacterium]